MITYAKRKPSGAAYGNKALVTDSDDEEIRPFPPDDLPIMRYQRAGDDADHPIIVDDYEIDENFKSTWLGHGASRPPSPLYTESDSEKDHSHRRGKRSVSGPPDIPRSRKRKRYFRTASPTSTDEGSKERGPDLTAKDSGSPSKEQAIVEIESPPGFDELRRTYVSSEDIREQVTRAGPKLKPKGLNKSGIAVPGPSRKASKSSAEKPAPRKSRASGRRKEKLKKTAYDIPGAKLLFDSFPLIPKPVEVIEIDMEDYRSRPTTPSGRQRSRTRSPSTHQIDIGDELLWEHVETSDEERDDERVEYYLLNDKRHPSCRPVCMAPQSRYGVHPRHMQHFSDWSLNKLGGNQDHSRMSDAHKKVFAHLKEHIFNDDREAIEAFIRNKPPRQRWRNYRKNKS